MNLIEEVDDGALTARANQQQDRFDAIIADTIGHSMGRASDALMLHDEPAAASAANAEEGTW